MKSAMSRIRWAAMARYTITAATVVLILAAPAAAYAAPAAGPVIEAVKTLPQVIASVQAWIMGILGAVATLFLVMAGVYWTTAGGDPAQVDKAKTAFRNSA